MNIGIEFDIRPHEGVGPIRFGMGCEEVNSALNELGNAILDSVGFGTVSYAGVSVVVEVCGSGGVQLIALYPEVDAVYRGLHVMQLRRDELVRSIESMGVNWVLLDDDRIEVPDDSVIVAFDDDGELRNVSAIGRGLVLPPSLS